MLPFKLIYHDKYDLHLGAHVFPSQKYRLIYETLVREKLAEPADFLQPEPANDEDILLVHSKEWVRKLTTGKLGVAELMRLEIPWSKEMIEACWYAAGGSILAGRRALEDGFSVSLAGGLHHAFPDHGEGFCPINDVAIAVRRLQTDGAVETAMIVDTDVHHGNGTAAIFGGDGTVFTLSIHQENNYPMPKPPSSIDIHLADRTGDADYLAKLEKQLQRAFLRVPPGDRVSRQWRRPLQGGSARRARVDAGRPSAARQASLRARSVPRRPGGHHARRRLRTRRERHHPHPHQHSARRPRRRRAKEQRQPPLMVVSHQGERRRRERPSARGLRPGLEVFRFFGAWRVCHQQEIEVHMR